MRQLSGKKLSVASAGASVQSNARGTREANDCGAPSLLPVPTGAAVGVRACAWTVQEVHSWQHNRASHHTTTLVCAAPNTCMAPSVCRQCIPTQALRANKELLAPDKRHVRKTVCPGMLRCQDESRAPRLGDLDQLVRRPCATQPLARCGQPLLWALVVVVGSAVQEYRPHNPGTIVAV